jgi:hypothetical protein
MHNDCHSLTLAMHAFKGIKGVWTSLILHKPAAYSHCVTEQDGLVSTHYISIDNEMKEQCNFALGVFRVCWGFTLVKMNRPRLIQFHWDMLVFRLSPSVQSHCQCCVYQRAPFSWVCIIITVFCSLVDLHNFAWWWGSVASSLYSISSIVNCVGWSLIVFTYMPFSRSF